MRISIELSPGVKPMVGWDWLRLHQHDMIPEPTMEVIVDGKTLSVNGNYKKDTIKSFMKLAIKEYTRM